MVTGTENVAPVSDAVEKSDSKEKLGQLFAEGRKLLIMGNKDLAIDKLSDATQLGVSLYGDLGEQMYEIYLHYGRAQLDYASDLALVLNQKVGEEDDSSDEEKDDEECEQSEDKTVGDGAVSADSKMEDVGESAEKTEKVDQGSELRNEDGDEKANVDDEEDTASTKNGETSQPMDALTDMISGAWEVLELARRVAEETLKKVTAEDEASEWKRRLADANFYIGQLMVVDEQFDTAVDELSKALAAKLEVLPEYHRELGEIHFQLARVHFLKEEFKETVQCYKKAQDVFQKKMEHLESIKNPENEKEIEKELNELEDITREIQTQITEAGEQEKLDDKIKVQLKARLLGSAAFGSAKLGDDVQVNDISSLIRKRKKPVEDDSESKKSKPEA